MAKRKPIPFDPTKYHVHPGRPHEVAGCPTGLSEEPQEGYDPLVVEKLEGRQEAGRDGQEEAEENLPP
jgi:hypothetical protein